MSAASATKITVRGAGVDAAVRARVTERLGEALARLTVKPVAARALFTDEDGPKGGAALRCALSVRVPYRPELFAEYADRTARRAFDGALTALERQLERYRERARDERRRPKKYYAAKRLLTPGRES